MHRGPKGGESLEGYFSALRYGLPRDPALAHRLDRETSGCLALGRHHKALERLGLLFKQGRVGKCYWAVVEGAPAQEEGLIDLPLGRLNSSRGWWMKVDPMGAKAQTRWRVLGKNDTLALLALTPLTGRTHQLRVHCAAMGFPILGDRIYGTRGDTDPMLHLHARGIEIPLYKIKIRYGSKRRRRRTCGNWSASYSEAHQRNRRRMRGLLRKAPQTPRPRPQ